MMWSAPGLLSARTYSTDYALPTSMNTDSPPLSIAFFYYQELRTLPVEKFREELLWRAGLFSALCDEFQLAKKGVKLLKSITM